MSEVRKTTAFLKLAKSIINACFVLLVSLPFLLYFRFDWRYKITVIAIFFVYQLIAALSPRHHDLGDLITKTHWIKSYPTKNHVAFAFLYTASFSTVFIWLYFPFDVLLINLLFIQLPFVLKTGYTLHGYLSGKMVGTRQS
jgi:hypothetical protein